MAQEIYKHILIATDGSELAAKGVSEGLRLAKELKAKVSAVTVTEPWTMVFGDAEVESVPIEKYQESMNESAKKTLNAVAEEAKSQGLTCQILHAQNQHPGEGILSAAKEHGCDLIVMSSHGRRGLAGLILGSQTVTVLTHSQIPVLVIR